MVNATIETKKPTLNAAETYMSNIQQTHQPQQQHTDHLADPNRFGTQLYTTHQVHQLQQQQPTSNIVYSRQFSSQMELPLCNSTAVGSTSNLNVNRNYPSYLSPNV